MQVFRKGENTETRWNSEVMFDISSPRVVTYRNKVHLNGTAPYYAWDQISDAVEACHKLTPSVKFTTATPQNPLPEYLLAGAACCQCDAFWFHTYVPEQSAWGEVWRTLLPGGPLPEARLRTRSRAGADASWCLDEINSRSGEVGRSPGIPAIHWGGTSSSTRYPFCVPRTRPVVAEILASWHRLPPTGHFQDLWSWGIWTAWADTCPYSPASSLRTAEPSCGECCRCPGATHPPRQRARGSDACAFWTSYRFHISQHN